MEVAVCVVYSAVVFAVVTADSGHYSDDYCYHAAVERISPGAETDQEVNANNVADHDVLSVG